jgi:hypothetical protein
MMARRVGHERLDGLAADHPQARRARLDLQRINAVMRSGAILSRELRALPVPPLAALPDSDDEPAVAVRPALANPPRRLRILEIGAGDGSLMLAVARRLAPQWPAADLTLLDRAPVVAAATLAGFDQLGWSARHLAIDVLDWAAPASASPPGSGCWDLIVANLFLHHFEGEQLASLLGAIAARCDAFCACEPRRGWLPLVASHLVAALGANAVTRADAVLSVRAGFRDDEIGALWPDSPAIWDTRECSAGLFSHCFTARRRGWVPIEAA